MGVTDDSVHNLTGSSLVDLLESHGLSWKSYNQKYTQGSGGACNTVVSDWRDHLALCLMPFKSKHSRPSCHPCLMPCTQATIGSSCSYARKHNPFMSFSNINTNIARCSKIVGASQTIGGTGDNLLTDINNKNLANFMYYVPGRCLWFDICACLASFALSLNQAHSSV
jgi:hypothetical protein